LETGVKRQSWLGYVHLGREGPLWIAVASKKKNKKEEFGM